MRIAICDDDQRSREALYQLLLSCEVRSMCDSIEEFSSGGELVDAYKARRFDLIFLDVEMPGLSGLETGQKIREMDEDVILVLLTNHINYAFESYSIEVFAYLIKPAGADEIKRIFARAVPKLLALHHLISIQCKNAVIALDIKEIIYIESYQRHIKFHTERGAYECVGKLSEYESKLSPHDFLRCHQGFLVNIRHIKSMDESMITTTTDESIEMSVRKRKYCKDRFQEYIGRYSF